MNIVVCIDGLAEGWRGGATNVFKLFNMLEDRTANQVAFYDVGAWFRPGIGVSELLRPGTGMSAKICRAYEFIFERFEAGDQIYLFGTGRGAATVALLAEMLHLFGVLPVGHKELIAKGYSIFNTRDPERRRRKAHGFVYSHHTMWCVVPFLGVWDTVLTRGHAVDELGYSGLGYKHYRPSLPHCVSNCYHALAIDDERKAFHPRIWSPEILPRQSMKQVWFSGMHADVGGGYQESALSDISLRWMVKSAERHGLRIYSHHGVREDPDPNGIMHDSFLGVGARWYAREARTWDVNAHGKPQVHASVLDRRLNRHNADTSSYAPWILDGDYEVESE